MGITGRSFTQSAWTLMLVILACSSKSTDSRKNCTPSSCGNIHNISYPFRLKNDPKHCGHVSYALNCENNITVLDFSSERYHVKAINYHNQTIRVVDPGFQKNNCSSVPLYSVPFYSSYDSYLIPYAPNLSEPLSIFISFLRCSHPVNSSLYVNTAACNDTSTSSTGTSSSLSHPKRYGYISYNDDRYPYDAIMSGDVEEGCTLEWTSFAPTRLFVTITDGNFTRITEDLSFTYVQNALVDGFELGFRNDYIYDPCEGWYEYHSDKCFPRTVADFMIVIVDSNNENTTKFNLPLIHLKEIPNHWILLIIVGLLFLARFILGAPLMIAFFIFKWRSRHLSLYTGIEDFLHNENNFGPIRYSYSDIKKMSNRFKQKLGEGGYGCVFKGKLRSGHFGAIKLLGKSKGNGQEFINEVATIGRIHHTNVVQLIGYCVEGSKRALVYDFMPNGSLDKYIYSKAGSISLSFKQMYEISLGVAKGIEYLHQGCDMQILHFDIKPHNILLDQNFIPKISDFGLAKLYPTENSIVTLTAVRGTMGYMAPELFYKNIGGVSHKADVYSFGMLLMEMASKRKNLNPMEEHLSQIYFPSWVYDQYSQGNFHLDMINVSEEERVIIKKMVIIALWCIQLKPSDRPSMDKVIEMLEGDVESLQMPTKPALYPEEMSHGDTEDTNLNPVCSNMGLTCTLSAR
ncbi:rust resistance kinase Lr10 isoform X3 [Rosa chinensis]|uniref:rust resistance kinase Lr10 isoform X3 n=1 Tax=Rosa chinensis TaxID=74649 RepID=UPI001AD8ED8E|nr:rust resistance kinase Lr10 isoform X3 [Rosa chinensis]